MEELKAKIEEMLNQSSIKDIKKFNQSISILELKIAFEDDGLSDNGDVINISRNFSYEL